jgi:hypothetical protein
MVKWLMIGWESRWVWLMTGLPFRTYLSELRTDVIRVLLTFPSQINFSAQKK